jgi:regulator of replication initiation timing
LIGCRVRGTILAGRQHFLRSLMVKSALARTVYLDPIDRLEDKVKLLVGIVTQLRAEQAQAAEENARLTEELEGLRSRVADLDGTTSELAALRDERELVRARVSDMLRQLDHLNA